MKYFIPLLLLLYAGCYPFNPNGRNWIEEGQNAPAPKPVVSTSLMPPTPAKISAAKALPQVVTAAGTALNGNIYGRL